METRRVLIKRGINSSEINASLCFFAGVTIKTRRGRVGEDKAVELWKNEKEKGGKRNGLLVHSRRESYI